MNDLLILLLTLIFGNFLILFGANCLNSDKPVLKLFGLVQWAIVASFMFLHVDVLSIFSDS